MNINKTYFLYVAAILCMSNAMQAGIFDFFSAPKPVVAPGLRVLNVSAYPITLTLARMVGMRWQQTQVNVPAGSVIQTAAQFTHIRNPFGMLNAIPVIEGQNLLKIK